MHFQCLIEQHIKMTECVLNFKFIKLCCLTNRFTAKHDGNILKGVRGLAMAMVTSGIPCMFGIAFFLWGIFTPVLGLKQEGEIWNTGG